MTWTGAAAGAPEGALAQPVRPTPNARASAGPMWRDLRDFIGDSLRQKHAYASIRAKKIRPRPRAARPPGGGPGGPATPPPAAAPASGPAPAPRRGGPPPAWRSRPG